MASRLQAIHNSFWQSRYGVDAFLEDEFLVLLIFLVSRLCHKIATTTNQLCAALFDKIYLRNCILNRTSSSCEHERDYEAGLTPTPEEMINTEQRLKPAAHCDLLRLNGPLLWSKRDGANSSTFEVVVCTVDLNLI